MIKMNVLHKAIQQYRKKDLSKTLPQYRRIYAIMS